MMLGKSSSTSTIVLITLSDILIMVMGLKIKNVWTPDVIENGTQQSALVDCDFSYEQKDLQSLELKWYFRHDPTPIYTWIPPKKPQVHPTFKNHINIEYEISSDPYLKHRALNLQDLSTKLSGRYSCRVSSIFQDDFKSRDLIIYSPARKTSLMIGWVTSKELNITCEAKDIYPEPNITIKIDGLHFANESIDISDEASRSVVWSQGTFSALVSKTLSIMETGLENSPEVTCEYVLEKTPYKEVRWQRIPPRPNVFQTQSGSACILSKVAYLVAILAINIYLP